MADVLPHMETKHTSTNSSDSNRERRRKANGNEIASESESEKSSYRACEGQDTSRSVPTDLFPFPLPLTPMEHYLVLDDSADHPMVVFIELIFTEELDLEVVTRTVREALHRHPLLASRIVRKGRHWEWVYDPTWSPTVRDFQSDPPVKNGRVESIDLHETPGVRAWYEHTDSRFRLVFQFHHACADGVGFRRFIIDWAVCYARARSAPDAPIHAPMRMEFIDPQLLLNRGCLKHLEDTPPPLPLTGTQRLRNFIYFFFRPPVPIERAKSKRKQLIDNGDQAEFIQPTLVAPLDLELSRMIIERSREEDHSLNEIGLALMFHTCQKWHEQNEVRGAGKRIRLLMPYDIRTRSDINLSASNRMSFAFLGRTHSQCRDWKQLLSSVEEEVQNIKDTRVFLDFITGLRSGLDKPRVLEWVLRRSRNMATAVFTYSGDMYRGLSRIFPDVGEHKLVGDALLSHALVAPPVRENTNIGIGFCLSGERVCFSLAWNRKVLTQADAQEFFDMFLDAWRRWAMQGHP